MSTTEPPPNADEDVSDFLRRIKELGDQREREDLERTRKLEEEIAEGRRLREARRQERARSLSPEKQSPSTTPQSLRSSRQLPKPESADTTTGSPSVRQQDDQPRKENQPPMSSSLKDSPSPQRSGTLSWQQRPPSLHGSLRSRPLSTLGRQSPSSLNADPSSSEATADDQSSRSDIAKALGAKDPSWFRQTSDRGASSAAYRRNREEEEETPSSAATNERRMLHGMGSPSTSREVQSPETSQSAEQPKVGRSGDTFKFPDRTITPTQSSQRFSPPSTTRENQGITDGADDDIPTTRYNRPHSPSKGMGGFVQSAMLARNNSVSKRWSGQPGAGFVRQDSQSRIGFDRPASREGLPESTSMPRLDENRSNVKLEPEAERSAPSSPSRTDRGEFRATAQHARSHSRAESMSRQHTGSEQTPSSPSKRWSPLKSTWLESALARPESPKPSPTPVSNQPSWMVQLNKNKQERMSKDMGKPLDLPSANISGARSPDTHSETLTKSVSNTGEVAGIQQSRSDPAKEIDDRAPPVPVSSKPVEKPSEEQPTKPGLSAKPTTLMSKTGSIKSKPATPPKKDINLQPKSRPSSTQSKPAGEELEFRAAFGKLRRTQTKNYVAPDELKDNIMRGKSGLSVTEGPQKRERRDSLKESLVQQKEAMKAKAAETPSSEHSREPSQDTVVPEAIAKRKAMQDAKPAEASTTLASKPSPGGLKTGVSSKLANRFNPGLAGLLARGPPPPSSDVKSPDANSSDEPMADVSFKTTSRSPQREEPTSGGQLQHMTKSRARGPKRRAPKAQSPAISSPILEDTPKSAPLEAAVRPAVTSKPQRPSSSSRNVTPTGAPSPAQSKPSPPSSSSRRVSANVSQGSPLAKVAPQKPSANATFKDETKQVSPTSAKTAPPEKRPSESPSVKNATARWGQEAQSTPTRREPIKLPTQKDEDSAMQNAGLKREVAAEPISKPVVQPKAKGLGITTQATSKPEPAPKQSATKELPSLSKPAQAPEVKKTPGPTVSKPRPSPGSQSTDAERLLQEFFDSAPVVSGELDVDAQAILNSTSKGDAKIKTLRKSITELTSDGKTIQMPLEAEHVLYSDSMYLCTHIFGSASGSRTTEVYLWVGKDIAEPTAEDAQVFARRAAKDASGSLVLVPQGKEPANFFQALGGILISRNGSGKSNTNKPTLLCGRKHLSHVAFDEVSFNVASFCSGFPFIAIPGTKPEKIYLWKGAGCSAEEVGCARLISMDLSPSNEVVEVDEGSEPADFLQLFPGVPGTSKPPAIPRSADHWRLKADRSDYKVRLFKVDFDVARPSSSRGEGGFASWTQFVRKPSQDDSKAKTQVVEVSPFRQQDLEAEHIYVLDAFFELYIIIGPLANTKPQAFTSALLFAQEYSILAASSEDRPNVPFCTVVLEGAPRDMKRVFRQWDDELVRTEVLAKGGSALGRGRSLRCVPLSAAIEVVRRS